MGPELSEAELAGMDALVDEPTSDEPASDGADAVETSAYDAESASDAAESGSPVAADPAWALQEQAAREFVGSFDAPLWRLASRELPIEGGVSFHDLVAIRERAVNGTTGDPAEAP